MQEKWVFWLDELGQEHNELVGRKSANLGEMTKIGAPVPPGFALSMAAYERFLDETGALGELRRCLEHSGGAATDFGRLSEMSDNLRQILESRPMPQEMGAVILSYYRRMCETAGIADVAVATRSAGAQSRPGQYESYLNVRGETDLLEKIKRVWSSSFNVRSLSASLRDGGPSARNPISVCVLKMVNARVAGIAFTADPNTGDPSRIIVEANWGLGESVVSGESTPDRFVLEKEGLVVHEKVLGAKAKVVSCSAMGTHEEDLSPEKAAAFCLTDEEAIEIGRLAKILEAHFDNTPQDLEWAIDDDLEAPENIVLLQARPAKIVKRKDAADMILDHMLSSLYHR
ncbi:MAG: PEP/pyruvate-binding domain-containing protein [Thermoleophilia bacterium]|nr:PEP/pyruvate-binding domain-containing protein [Thermoleophilia bacterium]